MKMGVETSRMKKCWNKHDRPSGDESGDKLPPTYRSVENHFPEQIESRNTDHQADRSQSPNNDRTEQAGDDSSSSHDSCQDEDHLSDQNDENSDQHNDANSRMASAFNSLRNAFMDRMRYEHEKAVVQTAQHIAKTLHEGEYRVTKGKCLIYGGGDRANTVKTLYENFSCFEIECGLKSFNKINEGDFDFIALYIFDVDDELMDSMDVVKTKSSDVPWLVVIQIEPDTDIGIGEDGLPDSLVVRTDCEEIVEALNEELVIQSVCFDIASIGSIALNRMWASNKRHLELSIINNLQQKVFLQLSDTLNNEQN